MSCLAQAWVADATQSVQCERRGDGDCSKAVGLQQPKSKDAVQVAQSLPGPAQAGGGLCCTEELVHHPECDEAFAECFKLGSDTSDW